jgi:hypothetical protein
VREDYSGSGDAWNYFTRSPSANDLTERTRRGQK